jgi:[CysO sulfur-carrier protein]-S-L-cysteine hydrolase
MNVDSALYDEMIAHAIESQPNECCGMVASKDGVAMRVYRVTNDYRHPPTGYVMNPKEVIGLLSEIEDQGWEFGATYHSHPRTAPQPSQTDINLALMPDTKAPLWPGTLYIIIGFPTRTQDAEVRAFQIDADGVEEVALSVQ